MKSNYIGSDEARRAFERERERELQGITDSEAVIIFIALIIFFVFIGWLLPMPSPFEKSKPTQAPEKTKKAPVVVAPPIEKKEVFIDLNEDGEPEWYIITPLEISE